MGIFAYIAIFSTLGKNDALCIAIALAICLIYASSDEIHQYFVPGRACRIFDVGVDTLGALTGTLILTLIILIVNSIAMHRKEKYSA